MAEEVKEVALCSILRLKCGKRSLMGAKNTRSEVCDGEL